MEAVIGLTYPSLGLYARF